MEENDFHNFKFHSLNDLRHRIDPIHILPSSTPRKLIDSFMSTHEESTAIDFEDSSIPFNGDFTSLLSVITGFTSFSSTCDSIKVLFTPLKKLKYFKLVIEIVLCYDLEVEQDLNFMNLFRLATSKMVLTNYLSYLKKNFVFFVVNKKTCHL